MLNIFAPINHLGVGVHAYNLAKAYTDLGNDVCLIPPFGNIGFHDSYVDRWTANRDKFYANDPSLMIFDIQFLTQFSGTPRIGFAVFETDGFTDVQLAALKSCDFLLTPSKWGQGILMDYGIDSFVVNEGIDLGAFHVNLSADNGTFKFVHVGKFEKRKGTLQILRCFFEAMEREDAELILHCQNPFMQDGGRGGILKFLDSVGFQTATADIYRKGGLSVRLTSHRDDIAEIYNQADCGIFPSKGEGWGLPIQECIASGVPTIVGCWSGQSEYLGSNYPFQLAFERSEMVNANDGIWFQGDRGNWHVVPDLDLINKIRWAFENARTFRKSVKWADTVKAVREFTWERAARQLEAFISKVK